jgi:hypothetical protein
MPDQYMAAAHAVSYGLRAARSRARLLCGVVTDAAHEAWWAGAVDNGLLSQDGPYSH